MTFKKNIYAAVKEIFKVLDSHRAHLEKRVCLIPYNTHSFTILENMECRHDLGQKCPPIPLKIKMVHVACLLICSRVTNLSGDVDQVHLI